MSNNEDNDEDEIKSVDSKVSNLSLSSSKLHTTANHHHRRRHRHNVIPPFGNPVLPLSGLPLPPNPYGRPLEVKQMKNILSMDMNNDILSNMKS